MVRAVLAPKSIEAQFIKRVYQGNDHGLVKAVLAPPRMSDVVHVCLCEDGRTGTESCRQSVQHGLRTLYEYWGMIVVVEIHFFSFMHPDQAAMVDILRRADVFYFAGVYTVPPALRTAMANSTLVTLLKEQVQYNQCAFFGVCGGAMIAGATNHYALPGLDLFNGITVQYDSNVGAGAVSVDTSYEAGLLQMTTGCALALLMTSDHVEGRSFVTIKNHSQWYDFAQRSTAEVQRLVQMKCAEWTEYFFSGERWYFNLQGYIWLRNEMYILQHGIAIRCEVQLAA